MWIHKNHLHRLIIPDTDFLESDIPILRKRFKCLVKVLGILEQVTSARTLHPA